MAARWIPWRMISASLIPRRLAASLTVTWLTDRGAASGSARGRPKPARARGLQNDAEARTAGATAKDKPQSTETEYGCPPELRMGRGTAKGVGLQEPQHSPPSMVGGVSVTARSVGSDAPTAGRGIAAKGQWVLQSVSAVSRRHSADRSQLLPRREPTGLTHQLRYMGSARAVRPGPAWVSDG